jgi:hypothetical protein
VQIKDRDTLLMLLTAMYVTKWEAADSSHVDELAGSPYFARLYNDAVDEIVRMDSDNPTEFTRWEHWRTIEARPVQLERTRNRIRQGKDVWQTWSREQKTEFIRILLSPFRANPATIEDLASL